MSKQKVSNYYFYLLPHKTYKALLNDEKETVLLLESQPFGNERFYRVASLSPIIALSDFQCPDKGRTAGYWQNFCGDGVMGGKFKLPQDVAETLKKMPVATLSVKGDSWEAVLENYAEEFKLGAKITPRGEK